LRHTAKCPSGAYYGIIKRNGRIDKISISGLYRRARTSIRSGDSGMIKKAAALEGTDERKTGGRETTPVSHRESCSDAG